MNIANDLFMWSISNFLDKMGENKLADNVRKNIVHDVQIKKKFAKEFDLYKCVKHYLKNNTELKEYLENLTKEIVGNDDNESDNEIKPVKATKEINGNHEKIDKLLGNKKQRKNTMESVDQLSSDSGYKVKTKKNKKDKKEKNRKTSIVSNITVESEKVKKSKKKDKKISSKVDEEESECEVKVEKSKKNKNRKPSVKEETDDDFEISPEAMKAKYNIQVNPEVLQKNNAPFKRIDENRFKVNDSRLINNSWDAYAAASGNSFAGVANNKLKVTAGKDFRKEKTKFKNKSGFGGAVLSTGVQSIKLNYDSDSD
jgi:hypothetical protein